MKPRKHKRQSELFSGRLQRAALFCGTTITLVVGSALGATTGVAATSPILPSAMTPVGTTSPFSTLGGTSVFQNSSPFVLSNPTLTTSVTPITTFDGNNGLVTGITPLTTAYAFPQTAPNLNTSLGGFALTTANNGLVTTITPITVPSFVPQTPTALNTSLGGFAPVGGSTGLGNANAALAPTTPLIGDTGLGTGNSSLLIPSPAQATPNQNTSIGGSAATPGSGSATVANPTAIAETTTSVSPTPAEAAQPGALGTMPGASTIAGSTVAQPVTGRSITMRNAGSAFARATVPRVPFGGGLAAAPSAVQNPNVLVQLLTPEDSAAVPGSTTRRLTATVISMGASVTNVEFFLNNADIGPGVPVLSTSESASDATTGTAGSVAEADGITVEETVFAAELPQVLPGHYMLTVVAADETGAVTFSPSVLISIR